MSTLPTTTVLALFIVLARALPTPNPIAAQSERERPSHAGERQAAHALALAQIGRSGLRSLLSASGNLGDLQNRAGSYRLASQLELARVAALSGLIAGLEAALQNPALPPAERAAIGGRVENARAELAAVPRYEARYEAVTAQGEGLTPSGFLGDRPLFLLVRGRGHFRNDPGEGLVVLSEGFSVGPVVAAERWIATASLSIGRTDVQIEPFEGESGSTALGASVGAGGILGTGWSAAIQVGHAWSYGETRIVRPGPGGDVEERDAGWSRIVSAKAEVKGSVRLVAARPGQVTLRPRAGAFLVSTRAPADPGRNAGREAAASAAETIAALRVGASLETELGPLDPAVYIGWEHEYPRDASPAIRDRQAVLGTAGVSWSWSRGRRLSAEYGIVRGLRGLRRVSELTVVLILDG